jgi:hypothetical protein
MVENDKLHREDGPAIERSDGTRDYWLNGELVTEDKVMGKTIIIDSKEIKLSNDSFNELKKQLIG